MKDDDFIKWVESLKTAVPQFVDKMKDNEVAGKYRLSWSGDIASSNTHWGLAQSTFAARILYIFDKMTPTTEEGLRDYILSFKRKDGFIYDSYVARKTLSTRIINTLRNQNLDYLLNKENKRAETRQAVAALINLNYKGPLNIKGLITSNDGIERYIKNLDWRDPWGAASHVNHLIFFLKFCSGINNVLLAELADTIENVLTADIELNKTIDTNKKIGANMKILMGMSLLNRDGKWISNKTLDVCLEALNKSENACVNFNTIYVITKCISYDSYRKDESIAALLRAVDYWRNNFYWEKYGGFSFFQGRAVDYYYGAKLTTSKPEPDLHGTAMFVWGILIVAKALGFDAICGLKEPVL
ncbi:MAG: hypothetical protein HY753_02100 [Nitrospirae bacterium]|nr:hypothetical protein [Nitrospirota bacterium]